MKKTVLFISSLLTLNLFSVQAQTYRDGFTNDFGAPVAQHWGAAPSGLTIAHLAHSGAISVVGTGTSGAYATLSYTPYDNPQMVGIGAYTGAGTAITSFNISSNNKVYAIISSTVNVPVTLQLTDVNGYVTSAGTPTYTHTVGTTSAVLTWDFTGATDGAYGGSSCAAPGPCTVDLTQIKQFGFQINAGIGNYSGTLVFDYIQAAGAAPVIPTASIATPSNGATITSSPISLTSSVTAGTGAIDSVSYYDGLTRLGSSATGSTYTYSWTGAAVGAHTLKAVVYDHLGIMNASTTTAITVSSAASVSAAQANISSSKLYPNPTSDMANVELNLLSSSDVKVTLTDVMGKEVMTIANGTMASLSQSFSVANLHKGIYTVNYFINGSAAKAELLMVK